jgi:Pyridoxamine 5'-phosphate oxidase
MSPGEPSFSTGRGAGRRSDRWNRRGGVDIASDLRTVELRRPRRRAKCGESSSCATHVGRISEGPRNSKLLQSDRYDKLERMRLPESACKLVESNALAHLVTLNPDGSPQVTCIWVGLDDGEIVSGHLSADQQKLKNVARDPRVALSIEGTEMLPPGRSSTSSSTGGRDSRKAGRRSSYSGSPTSTSGPASGSRRWTTRRPARSCASPSSESVESVRGSTNWRDRRRHEDDAVSAG